MGELEKDSSHVSTVSGRPPPSGESCRLCVRFMTAAELESSRVRDSFTKHVSAAPCLPRCAQAEVLLGRRALSCHCIRCSRIGFFLSSHARLLGQAIARSTPISGSGSRVAPGGVRVSSNPTSLPSCARASTASSNRQRLGVSVSTSHRAAQLFSAARQYTWLSSSPSLQLLLPSHHHPPPSPAARRSSQHLYWHPNPRLKLSSIEATAAVPT